MCCSVTQPPCSKPVLVLAVGSDQGNASSRTAWLQRLPPPDGRADQFLQAWLRSCDVSCPRFQRRHRYLLRGSPPSEASANLARYDGVKYGYRSEQCRHLAEMTARSRTEGFLGEEPVQRRILIATLCPVGRLQWMPLQEAQQVRNLDPPRFRTGAFGGC